RCSGVTSRCTRGLSRRCTPTTPSRNSTPTTSANSASTSTRTTFLAPPAAGPRRSRNSSRSRVSSGSGKRGSEGG
ncbi:unnamed protein product, partial [Closterium sp. NIES-53]